MPLFLCRWPNGDCSVTWARDKQDAIAQLDQVANAEGCPIRTLSSFQAHFYLKDDGQLGLDEPAFGESTEDEIFQWAYPILEESLMKAYGDGKYDSFEKLPRNRKTTISRSIQKERDRVKVDKSKARPPQTERGRELKKLMGAPTAVVDELVRHQATTVLKKFSGRGKPN